MTTSANISKIAVVTDRAPAWRDIASAPKPSSDRDGPPKPIYLYFDGDHPYHMIGFWDSRNECWRFLGDLSPTQMPTHWQPVTPPRKYTLNALLEEMRQARNELLDEYLENTKFLSSITAMQNDPLFAQLVGIGEPLGFMILDRMVQGELHVQFFGLLREIFQESPVKPEHAGLVNEMANDWLTWYEMVDS